MLVFSAWDVLRKNKIASVLMLSFSSVYMLSLQFPVQEMLDYYVRH